MGEYLESVGYETDAVHRGPAGIEKIHNEQWQAAILDVMMPGMDGFALLEHLRAKNPELPVLAVSGCLEASEVREYAFDGFIDKPLSLDHLRDLVEATVAHYQKSNEE